MKGKFYMASFSEVFSKTSATEIIREALLNQGYDILRVDVKCPSMTDAGQSRVIEFDMNLVEASLTAFKVLPPGATVMTFVSEQLMAIDMLRHIGQDITAVYYTHSAFDVHPQDTFGNPYSEGHRLNTHELLQDSNIQICCQTEWGQDFILKEYGRESTLLPYFVDVGGLYHVQESERKGLLWGTRYDMEYDIKGFREFVDNYADSGLLRIMVEQSSYDGVMAYLEQEEVKEFDVRPGISGDAKAEFISTSKYAVNLSSVESYGIFMAETSSVIPTYCPRFYSWMSEFGVPETGGWAKEFNQTAHNKLALSCWDNFLK